MAPHRRPPPQCAVCGADIPPKARACPDCGADERTGWREDSVYDGLELPDEAWADGDDQAPLSRPPSRHLPWYWWAVGVAVLLAFALGVLGLR